MHIQGRQKILTTTLLVAGFATLAACGAEPDDAPVFRDAEPTEPAEPAVPPAPPGNPPGLGANAQGAGGANNGLAGGWAATSENLLARADLMPTEGNDARGTVVFERSEDGDGVVVRASLTGLAAGPHGFHVHQNGDCSGPDASAAGDHWNPGNAEHGAPDDPLGERHAGDLGNVTAGDAGRVDEAIESDALFENGRLAILGRAIVVHASSDDLETQPSGESGDPVACGVIRSGLETSRDGGAADPAQAAPPRVETEDDPVQRDPVG